MFDLPEVLESTQHILGDVLLLQFFVKSLLGLFLKDTLPHTLRKADFDKMYSNPLVADFFYFLYCMQFDRKGQYSTICAIVLAVSELFGKAKLGWTYEWILKSAGFLGGWFLVAAVVVMSLIIFAHLANYMVTSRHLDQLKKYQVRSDGIPELSIANYWKSVSAKHNYFIKRQSVIQLVRSFKQAGISHDRQGRLQAAVNKFLRAVDVNEFIAHRRVTTDDDNVGTDTSVEEILSRDGRSSHSPVAAVFQSVKALWNRSPSPSMLSPDTVIELPESPEWSHSGGDFRDPRVGTSASFSASPATSNTFRPVSPVSNDPFPAFHQSFECHLRDLVREVKSAIDDGRKSADSELRPCSAGEAFLSQLEALSHSFFLLPLQSKIISTNRDPSESSPLKMTKDRLRHVKEKIDQLKKTLPSFLDKPKHDRRIVFFSHVYELICDYYESDMGRGYQQVEPDLSPFLDKEKHARRIAFLGSPSHYAFVLQNLVKVLDVLNVPGRDDIDALENLFDQSSQSAFFTHCPNIQIKMASRILDNMASNFFYTPDPLARFG